MAMSTFGFSLVLWQVSIPLVVAAPMETDPVMVENNGHVVVFGQHPAYRIAAVVTCILYASLLALAHGEYPSRARY
jgi:hypothetical protein